MADDKRPTERKIMSHSYQGNVAADNVAGSGWFVGQFVAGAQGLRHQNAVELKWGVHRRGDRRPAGALANHFATTISILVRGVLRTDLVCGDEHSTVILANEGDYLIFGPEVTHSWEAIEDAIVVTVRFPSVDVSRQKPAAAP